MPKPVYLSSFQLDYLRAQLQRTSGIVVLDARGCRDLVHFLEKTHKVFISESTLKRLFGLISSNKSASLYTLNLMASVLSFSSWKNLTEHIEHTSVEEVNHVLLHHYLPKSHLETTPYLKSNELKVNSWSEAYQLHIYCSSLINAENWKALDELLHCSVNVADLQQFDYLIFAFQPICLQAFQGNVALIDVVMRCLKSSEIARVFILTGQVFDSKLNEYYGKWIESFTVDFSDDFYPFMQLMKCQKCYINQQIPQAKEAFGLVLKWAQIYPLHPILQGRVGAWDYILNQSETCLTQALANHRDELSQVEILQFASRLVWQYSNDKKVFKQFDDLSLSDVNLTNTFYQKGRLDCYKLAKAYNLYLQKSPSYKDLIKQVNPHYFHLSDLQWLQSKYQQLIAD